LLVELQLHANKQDLGQQGNTQREHPAVARAQVLLDVSLLSRGYCSLTHAELHATYPDTCLYGFNVRTLMLSTTLCSALLLVLLSCSGIFATHLHLLLTLLRGYPRVLPYKMAVRVREQQPHNKTGILRLEPTMRLEPGECTESLALEVAEEQGIPGSILDKAKEYFATLQDIAGDESLDPSGCGLVETAARSVRFVDAASDSSGGTGSAGAAAPQPGSGSDLPQQQQQQQQESDAAGGGAAAASSRRRRRNRSSTRKSATR
jgi:hypothetical protein